MKAIKPIIILSLIFCSAKLLSQNVMTSSPYSMFGIGEMSAGLYGRTVSMGGVSYGMRGPTMINSVNPAGLVGMDSSHILGEISSFVKNEWYSSNGNSNEAFTGNFSAIALGGRLWPRWYTSVGLIPYTSVGYYFQTQVPLEGTAGSYYTSTFEGSGGINKLYWSNAFVLPGNLSVGVNISYLFGTLKQTEAQSTTSVADEMRVNAFHADFGVQYVRRLGKESLLTLGAVYGYKQELNIDKTSTVTSSTTTTTTKKKGADQYIPQFAGVGFALEHKKATHAMDYTFYQYSALNSGDSRVKFADVHELRYGISYLPAEYSSQAYWKQITYKAGVSVSTPSYKINGKSGIAYRLSMGLDFPVLNGALHTALFYDYMNVKGNLRRNVAGFTFTYSFGERLYKVKL